MRNVFVLVLCAPASDTSHAGLCPGREGIGEETGSEIWDPLDISGSVSDEALMWFRHAELKHGRAAMVSTRTAPKPAVFVARCGIGAWPRFPHFPQHKGAVCRFW